MGDEYIESYWRCKSCGTYTKETYHDRFSGEADSSVSGPISPQEGDAVVATIKECKNPSDKRCKCAVHRKMSGGY